MNDTARLDLLKQYDILDTAREPPFDNVVRIVASVLAMPISLVTFVDEDRVWFKACHGMPDNEVARAPGFCASAIEQEKPWLVEDTSTDPRCAEHPWVTGSLKIRSYAGIPLRAPEGHCLGTLCSMDTKPRRLKDGDVETLSELAAVVVDKLVSRVATKSAIREKNMAVDVASKSENQSRLLSAVVQSSQDAIVTKDLDGRVTSWNAAAEHLFGFTEDEIIGQPILRVIPRDRLGEEDFVIGSIAAGRQVDHYETVRRHKNGRLIPISITVSPIWDDRGKVIGASKIARDITDRKSNQERIEMLMREVDHRVKNQYAVILSMLSQTRRTTQTPAEFETRFRERIMALSRSHDLLVTADWRGTTISELVKSHIEPFNHRGRFSIDGPSILISPVAAQYLGMAFHELSINAAERSALDGDRGRIDVVWSIELHDDGNWLHLVWEEKGGPNVDQISEGGFGQVVLRRIAPNAVSGRGQIETAKGSLVWTLDAPLSSLVASENLS